MPNKRICSTCGVVHGAPKHEKCPENVQNTNALLLSLQSSLELMNKRMEAVEKERTEAEKATPKAKKPKPKPKAKEKATELRDSSEDSSSDGEATPSALKSNARLQQLVDMRMLELGVVSSDEEAAPRAKATTTQGKRSHKSGRVKTASDFVLHQVEWPHFHIFRGTTRQPASYDELSVPEFVCGFLRALEQEDDNATRLQRLEHLRHLMADAAEFGWQGARNFHGILLQEMEKGRISWADVTGPRVQDMRRQYSQQATRPDSTDTGRSSGATKAELPAVPCYYYQRGICKQAGDHKSAKGQPLFHACMYCHTRTGAKYPHTENDCVRKEKDGVNDGAKAKQKNE